MSSEQKQLKQQYTELQNSLTIYNQRVEAIQHDIALTTDSEQKVILKVRLQECQQERQAILDDLEAIEQKLAQISKPDTVADDGQLIPEQPTFPHSLRTSHLRPPGGAMKIEDKFYINRKVDERLRTLIIQTGITIVIQGPPHIGKTSLLIRGCNHAFQKGFQVVHLTLYPLSTKQLASEESFLQWLAVNISRRLGQDLNQVYNAWQKNLGPSNNITYFMEDYILSCFSSTDSIVLALDEVDTVLKTPFYQNFFAMLRAWHDLRSVMPELWEKLTIVLVISTEPHLLIDNINQSPFNIADATTLRLQDFDKEQVSQLNHQYGSPLLATQIPQLMDLVGGQPYLTHLVLYTLATTNLNWSHLKQNAPTNNGIFSTHLHHYHQIIIKHPHLQTTLKQIINNKPYTDGTACLRLQQAGLLIKDGPTYRLRCELYNRYFEEYLK